VPDLSPAIVSSVVTLTFCCAYLDLTVGMGYGTILTPILLSLGFGPMEVVPVVLLSQLVCGLLGGFFHHREGNVDLRPSTARLFRISEMVRPSRYLKMFKETVPSDLKIALLLSACGVVGAVTAVVVAVSLPKSWVRLYIGCLVLAMGVLVLVCINARLRFSWYRIVLLGVVASFNKAISGGGYGPVVTSGQILSGVESKSAVGITAFARALTCLVGVAAYLFASSRLVDWRLAPWVVGGAVFAVPLSARSTRIVNMKWLKLAMAVITIVVGAVTITGTLGKAH
jgi:uncharacterized membrane protein YfcA